MKTEIVEIANTYMEEHDGELPLLILAKNATESRIMRCHLRPKREQVDQATFMRVMRLAMIVYGYTEYQFVVKPEFNYESLQMTKNIWAVGCANSQEQRSAFYEVVNDELTPYFEEMKIGGYVARILPSEEERKIELKPAVLKQIKLYVENCTYHLPIKNETASAESGLDALFQMYS